MPVQFTDDEIVALTLMKAGGWGTPLPTVDLTDKEAVQSAGHRGIRSLTVRRILPRDVGAKATLVDVAALALQNCVNVRPALFLYAALFDRPWNAIATSVSIFPPMVASEPALFDVTLPNGMHEVDMVEVAEAQAGVDAMISEAWESGVASGAPDEAALMVLSRGESAEIFAVRRGSSRAGSIQAESQDLNVDWGAWQTTQMPKLKV